MKRLILVLLAAPLWAQTTQIDVTITVPNDVIPSIQEWRRTQFANHYELAGGIDAAATTATLSDAVGITVGASLMLGSEEVRVTAITGSQVTLNRGIAGTTAAPHLDGSGVQLLVYPNNIAILSGIIREWVAGVLDQHPTQAILDARALIEAQLEAIQAVKEAAVQ